MASGGSDASGGVYLMRLIQSHETFRRPEIEALAKITGVTFEYVRYSEYSPYCILRLPSEAAARALVRRSILSRGVYELWGVGATYEKLHADIRRRTQSKWPLYSAASFKFDFDHYQGKRSSKVQHEIILSFSYLGFQGPTLMKDADEHYMIFEDYEWAAAEPKMIYFGRLVATSDRDAIWDYSLKQRKYISTTSMDSELALVTANLTLAASGKLFYDPFVGTGSFPIACSHFGAMSFGSDIDGRSVRGKKGCNIQTSFAQYGLQRRYLDGFIADLTHAPLRVVGGGWLDGIVCDPPYGVREGLKVLGSREGKQGKEVVYIDGEAAHLQDKYIPPKRPYSFTAMLDDILSFASLSLVPDGRLSLWMPTANDEEIPVELAIPTNPSLEIVSVCVQAFNKWSRRLLTYRRLTPVEDAAATTNLGSLDQSVTWTPKVERVDGALGLGQTASDLNPFRKKYFQGFRVEEDKLVMK